jgi:hypothetical protein
LTTTRSAGCWTAAFPAVTGLSLTLAAVKGNGSCAATWPNLQAEGVDISQDALARAREAAGRLGAHERLTLHHQDAAGFVSPGRSTWYSAPGPRTAFGGLLPTPAAAGKHLAPGGRVLTGEGFWDREPSGEAIEMLGDFTDRARCHVAPALREGYGARWTRRPHSKRAPARTKARSRARSRRAGGGGPTRLRL